MDINLLTERVLSWFDLDCVRFLGLFSTNNYADLGMKMWGLKIEILMSIGFDHDLKMKLNRILSHFYGAGSFKVLVGATLVYVKMQIKING